MNRAIGEIFPIYLNVGRTINDGKFHLYDITKKIEDTADRINGLERPKPNEGYAQRNDISNESISEPGKIVNSENTEEDYQFLGDETSKAKELERMSKLNRDLQKRNDAYVNGEHSGDVDSSERFMYEARITEKDVAEVRSIGRKFVTQFSDADIIKSEKWAMKLYADLKEKSPYFRAGFGDWRKHDSTPVEIANIPEYIDSNDFRKNNRGTFVNKDTMLNQDENNAWKISVSRSGETNTISHSGSERNSEYGLSGIQELVEKAILLDTEVHEHHTNNKPNEKIIFDHKFYALGRNVLGDISLYKITVEDYFQSTKEPFKKRFHNLRYIEKIAENIGGRTFDTEDRSGGSTNDVSTTYSVSDLFEFVKRYDPEFNPNPVHYTALNNDGTPKLFYHGSQNEFDSFDRSKAKKSGLYGSGFYFTDSDTQENVYGNKYTVYLSYFTKQRR